METDVTTYASSKALPNEWIGRLFSRFRSIYGNNADRMFARADEADLLSTWAAELAAFSGYDIRLALDAMRFAYVEFPPTLFQFAALCRDAMRRRAQSTRAVTRVYGADDVDPEVVAHVHQLVQNFGKPKNTRDWARRILQREAEGERLPAISGIYAREALGMATAVAQGES